MSPPILSPSRPIVNPSEPAVNLDKPLSPCYAPLRAVPINSDNDCEPHLVSRPSQRRRKAKPSRRTAGYCPRCHINRRFQGGPCPPCRATLEKLGTPASFNARRQRNREAAEERLTTAQLQIAYELARYKERHPDKSEGPLITPTDP